MKSFVNISLTFQVEDLKVSQLLLDRFIGEIGVRPIENASVNYFTRDEQNIGQGVLAGYANAQQSQLLPAAPPPEKPAEVTKPSRKKTETPPPPPAAETPAEQPKTEATAPAQAPAEAPATQPDAAVDLPARVAELRKKAAEKIGANVANRKAVQDIVAKYSADKADPAVSKIPAHAILQAIKEVEALS